MTVRLFRKYKTVVVWTLLVSFIGQWLAPLSAFGLTSGPSQPEFSSFEPIHANNLVNDFDGSFMFNLPVLDIPGADGGGYQLGLSYHSGGNLEEEASWVGYGWTLNPGALNRGVQAIPDDYKNDTIIHYNKSIPVWTKSLQSSASLEYFSKSENKKKGAAKNEWNDTSGSTQLASVSFSITNRYNNYKGFSKTLGFGLNAMGILNFSGQQSGDDWTFSMGINPAAIVSQATRKNNKKGFTKTQNFKKDSWAAQKKRLKDAAKNSGNVNLFGSSYGLFSYTSFAGPGYTPTFDGLSFNGDLTGSAHPVYSPIGIEIGEIGSFSVQYPVGVKNQLSNGYLYNVGDLENDNAIASDYLLSHDNAFDGQDFFLPVALQGGDNYMATGEGLAGGFRLYDTKIGHFVPAKEKSLTHIVNVGFEGAYGANLGLGIDIGYGYQRLKTGQMDNNSNLGNYQFNENSPKFFRFVNDMGGKVVYTSDTINKAVASSTEIPFPHYFSYLDAAPEIDFANNDSIQIADTSVGRSSYIKYFTNAQVGACLTQNPANPTDCDCDLTTETKSFTDAIRLKRPNALAQFVTYNESGQRYVYGLAAHSRNTDQLQFPIDGNKLNDEGGNWKNYLAYFKIKSQNENNDYITGNRKPAELAHTFLLTQITTPDYIDVNHNNKLDEGDFGGWTQFHYNQRYGGSNWYRWRIPYTGMLYHKNQLSDPLDDIGIVQTGEKEIYYLKAVETKTHIAFFITNSSEGADFSDYVPVGTPGRTAILNSLNGSGKKRSDSFAACKDTTLDGFSIASFNKNAKDTVNGLEKLERIVLYAKGRFDKPVKVAHFEYDYSLCKNLPNSLYGVFPNTNTDPAQREKSGKLTLRRVWFEYEGVTPARITPYEFYYSYKSTSDYADGVGARYASILDPYQSLSVENENPDYDPFAIDRWGSYQRNGDEKYQNQIEWVDQQNDPNLDAGAWQLKRIVYPGGGELHVQYEQHTYSYVQDKEAMAMVSLNNSETEPEYKDGTRNYYLHLIDMGVQPGDTAAENWVINKINELRDRREKFYFKFLYALLGDEADLNYCQSEFIDGFAPIEKADRDSAGVYIRLKKTDNNRFPRQICYDYYLANAAGKVEQEGCMHSKVKMVNDILKSGITFGSMVDASANAEYLVNGQIVETNKDKVCKAINPRQSYIRIPVYHPKKGGGARVKRILQYDDGIESGAEGLYGTEYVYEDEANHFSYGVAANEPAAGEMENALVQPMPRGKKSGFDKIVSGRDLEQQLLPLVHELQPNASIGYSKIITRNIHQGVTGTGYMEKEFYTYKDFPLKFSIWDNNTSKPFESTGFKEIQPGAYYSNLQGNVARDMVNIPAPFFSYDRNCTWAGQGYVFVQHNMHGQLKSVKNWGVMPNGQVYLTSSETYSYAKPGEPIKMLRADGTYYWDTPGKEEEISLFERQIEEESLNFNLEIDITMDLVWTPPFYLTGMASCQYNFTENNIHVVTKVIRYPVILKKVTREVDGITTTQENMAFHPSTGKPVLTRSYDSFHGLTVPGQPEPHDGSMYALSIPASDKYPQMGQKAKNIQNTNQLSEMAGEITTYGKDANPLRASGDSWTLNPLKGVVSAGAVTYQNDWTSSWTDPAIRAQYGVPATDSLVMARLNQNWKPWQTYVYKDSVRLSANNLTQNPIYRAGMIKEAFEFFDWQNLSANDTVNRWLKTTEITRYSPNGLPLEERDLSGIYSSVEFGYKNLLPVWSAQNARYGTAGFLDFENEPVSLPYTNDFAHTGKVSRLLWLAPLVLNDSALFTTQLKNKGLRLMVWAKTDAADAERNANLALEINGSMAYPLKYIARSGEWALYEALVTQWPANLIVGQTMNLTLKTNNSSSVWIDDARWQPNDAAMSAFVYDTKTLRPVATFDEQHFGLFFQYNREGKLVRKLKETERGTLTIQETQYNTPATRQRPRN